MTRQTNSDKVHASDGSKVNSRVTKAHIASLQEAMDVALDKEQNVSLRLGYLSYAVASVLKDVGITGPHAVISARMWDNFKG